MTLLTNVLNSWKDCIDCISHSLSATPQQQIMQYLKDMFDHDKVRFTSAQSLAEDIVSLSHRRSDILLGYLGIDSLLEPNGALPQGDTEPGPSPSNHH